MTKKIKIKEETFQFLLRLFDKQETNSVFEVLKGSEIHLGVKQIQVNVFGYKFHHTLLIKVEPEVYLKHESVHTHMTIHKVGGIIGRKYSEITGIRVDAVDIRPELSKFQILANPIKTALTGWAEINDGQDDLIQRLLKAEIEIDFQNIGNASRTLLQKLSNIVFDPQKHIPKQGVDVSAGKFKNRLHTFIRTELSSSQDEELKDYVDSLITTAEKAVDLTNKTTHDLRAYRLMAESCVISAVTVIQLVQLIHNHKLTG